MSRFLALIVAGLLTGCATIKPPASAHEPDAEFGKLQAVAKGKHVQPDSFAELLKDYTQQSDFNCTHPLFARYFQQRYPTQTPFKPCSAPVPFFIMTRLDSVHPVWIDPKRVRSIHLLFAGNGQGFASRYGHVALRLVVCPASDSPDTDCDLNVREHVVLGYGAHIDDLELDTFKALKGGYNAYLFASPFMDTYQNYAIGEFREIYSLPLRLNTEQRERMVRELAEIHWGFADEYHFFSKNCTTLLQQALRGLSPEFTTSREMADDYLRPDHFFNALRNSPLAEGEKLASLERAEQEGYYFSSTKPFYEQAVTVIKAAMSQATFSDIESYLKVGPVHRRQAIVQDSEYVYKLQSDRHLRDAQIMLEELAAIRSERELMMATARYFHDHLPGRLDTLRRRLDAEQANAFEECLLAPIALLVRPIQRQEGIPDEFSIASPAKLSPVCKTPEGLKHLDEALSAIGEIDPEHWQPIARVAHYWKESISNVLFLKNEVCEFGKN